MNSEQLMRHAIALSEEAVRSGHGGPFGAVIASDGNIVADGHNRVISASDPTAHAEIVAIRQACDMRGTFSLAGCDIYCSCEPCPMCLSAIYWARLERVYYANSMEDAREIGFDDARVYQELVRDPSQRSIPAERLLAAEARTVFDVWRANPDRTAY